MRGANVESHVGSFPMFNAPSYYLWCCFPLIATGFAGQLASSATANMSPASGILLGIAVPDPNP